MVKPTISLVTQDKPDGWLKLIASAFKGQYATTNSSSCRAYTAMPHGGQGRTVSLSAMTPTVYMVTIVMPLSSN